MLASVLLIVWAIVIIAGVAAAASRDNPTW